uniref:Transcription factor GATA1 n=1 Tax=Diospyros kaki TaxID=35925 RepID=A0A3S8T8Z3_DIOKA|nr:transcription factor GATA1 [Diospyros kaki]
MSTPVYLNSPPSPFPFLELKEDHPQLHFFIPPSQAAASSLSSPIFFDTTRDPQQKNDQQANYKYILHGGSSDHQVIASSSGQPMVGSSEYSHEFSSCKLDGEANKPAKWMSWKMRMINSAATDKQEGITPKFHDQEQHKSGSNSPNNGNNTVRVCSDCSTTKTPLWRSGPQGPKSLCNACGIRQRKARRAMAAAAVAAAATQRMVVGPDNSSTTRPHKVQSKEKKPRMGHQYKKPLFKLPGSPQCGEKNALKEFALSLSKNNSSLQQSFPKDVEEAAVLLMALSCGRL